MGYADGGVMAAPPEGASGGDAISMWGNGGPLGIPMDPRPTYAMQGAMRNSLAMAPMNMGGAVQGYATGGTLGMPSDTNPYQIGAGSPYDQLNQAGAIPPFLQRAQQQGLGNQAYGTNVPQKAYLPPGLPLESKLGYNQMSPSEQQAYQSYASSYGVDPTDLLAQIGDQTAPGRASQKYDYTEQ